MPKRCVAANCSNTNKEGVSLHTFPTDETRKKLWTKQVQRTRANWSGPSTTSVICAEHFTDESFDESSGLQMAMGFTKRRKLKPDAVPTIFKRHEDPTPPLKPRGAYLKRKRQEVLNESLTSDVQPSTSANIPSHSNEQVEYETPMQSHDQTIEISTQTSHQLFTRDKQTQYMGYRKNAAIQVDALQIKVDAETQTTILPTLKLPSFSVNTDSESSEYEFEDDMKNDPDFLPDSSSVNSSTPNISPDRPYLCNEDLHSEPKYIVFWSCLLQLFTWLCCPNCGMKGMGSSKHVIGTLLLIKFTCHQCGAVNSWKSQPSIGNFSAGNILLSGAILYSGCVARKVLRVFQHMGVATIKMRTFFYHQQQILLPTIYKVWKTNQENVLENLILKESLVLGGDGRADSPGHSAKYGTYSMIELESNKVIDIQLVQSNECGGSYHMEKSGLERSFAFLEEAGLPVADCTFVSDRHRSIAKWIRENWSGIDHKFDIWHVAKALRKKLEPLAKERNCKDLQQWIQSIINHLYWSATSSNDGPKELIVAKWKSVVSHVTNVHKGHHELFPQCLHDKVERQWLKKGSEVAVKLEDIICNNRLCKDIENLSGNYQTFHLEAFHSVITHFCPKMYHFSFTGMVCRNILAALHYNENAERAQLKTRDIKKVYSVRFPKYKRGGYVLQKIRTGQTFDYVNKLMAEMWDMCVLPIEQRDAKVKELTDLVPDSLASQFQKPDKDDVINNEYRTRFKKKDILLINQHQTHIILHYIEH